MYVNSNNAEVGNNVKIGYGVRIYDNVVIRDNVTIHPYTCIGDNPQHIGKEKNPNGKIIIDEGTIIREFVTIHSPIEEITKVGKNCYLMATSHIAHDCILKDNIVLCNSVNLSGHTKIDNYVTLGLNSTTHQYVTIGEFAMVGMNTPINNDVLPFSVVYGNPARWFKANKTGLERHSTEKILLEAVKVLSWGLQHINYYLSDEILFNQDIISLGLKSDIKEVKNAFQWFQNNRNRGNRKIIKYSGKMGFNLEYVV